MGNRTRGGRRERNYTPLVVTLSIVIIGTVAALFLIPGLGGTGDADLTVLPKLNAGLNSATFLLLIGAYVTARRKQRLAHERYVYGAVALTLLFFISYITYHFSAPATQYGGEGPLRTIYFFILITHILSAIIVIPFALLSLFTGRNREIRRHRRIARWSMPLWLYTSFTGVLVYILVSPYY